MTTYKLANIIVPTYDGPEIDAWKVGSIEWTVELTSNANFSPEQITYCVLGTTTTISVSITGGDLVFNGTVTEFVARPGYSKVVLDNAIATMS